jgi:hypothetical protein
MVDLEPDGGGISSERCLLYGEPENRNQISDSDGPLPFLETTPDRLRPRVD